MTARRLPREHGTERGYHQHWADGRPFAEDLGSESCGCREAHAAYQRTLYRKVKACADCDSLAPPGRRRCGPCSARHVAARRAAREREAEGIRWVHKGAILIAAPEGVTCHD